MGNIGTRPEWSVDGEGSPTRAPANGDAADADGSLNGRQPTCKVAGSPPGYRTLFRSANRFRRLYPLYPAGQVREITHLTLQSTADQLCALSDPRSHREDERKLVADELLRDFVSYVGLLRAGVGPLWARGGATNFNAANKARIGYRVWCTDSLF
jgi:hypothetical protein